MGPPVGPHLLERFAERSDAAPYFWGPTQSNGYTRSFLAFGIASAGASVPY
jgi:hypothetical protein